MMKKRDIYNVKCTYTVYIGPKNPSVASSEWLPWFHPFQMCHLWNLCTILYLVRSVLIDPILPPAIHLFLGPPRPLRLHLARFMLGIEKAGRFLSLVNPESGGLVAWFDVRIHHIR